METRNIEKKNIEKKGEDKYKVYPNDIKFMKFRNIDPKKAEWYDKDTHNNYMNGGHDTIGHRIEESKKNDFSYLDLSHLDLIDFPDLSQSYFKNQLKNIKYLFISNNKITSCNDKLKFFENLHVLDISHNNISEISYIPPNLIELVCNNNNLIRLVNNMDNIVRLECSDNKLIVLPSMKNLTHLLCENNKLNGISEYPNCQKIICSNNPIFNINSQPKLTYLDCSRTNIKEKLLNMPSLEYLNCNNTKISNVSNLSNIESIDMCFTDIKHIPYLTKLNHIKCNADDDIRISDSYKNNTNLEFYKENHLMNILFHRK